MAAAVLAVAAGHCKSTRAQAEALAQTNSNSLNLNAAVGDQQRRAQQSAARATATNQKQLTEASKRSGLSFSGSLQQNGGATERRLCIAPAKRQQSLAQPSKQITQAADKLQRRLPSAVGIKSLNRGEAPEATDSKKFGSRRQQVARHENNLRHWRSATGPLEDLPVSARNRRPFVGLPSTCKFLNDKLPEDAAARSGHTFQVRRQGSSQGVEVPARIKQVLAASRVCAAASQVSQRRPRATTSAAPTAAKPSAAARALLLTKAAPKRAHSCNQLASRLSDQPKIAKTTVSPAVTNSRVRQGLLFARRQCQLALTFNSVDDLSTPISRRVSHLAMRVQSQHFDRTVTRETKSRQVTLARPVGSTQKPLSAAIPPKGINKAERSISHSCDKTRKLVGAASTPKRSLEVARHLHRRWSSLESSNQDDDDELSSPSSSSSSILSTTDSTCLLLTTSQALGYLTPRATGCSLINQQAAGGERQLGRRSSLQTRVANQARRPKPPTTRRTSERSGIGTRRIEPADEGQRESEFAADEISLEKGRERRRKLVESQSEPGRTNRECDNKDQACGDDCESLDIVDIVVKQPNHDWHFDKQPPPSGEEQIDSHSLDPESPRECVGREIESSQPVCDFPSNNEIERLNRTDFVLFVNLPNRDEQFAESDARECNRVDYHKADGSQAIPSEIDQSLDSSRAPANLVAVAPVRDQDKMMISTDHGDTKETSQHWPIKEDANISNNNYQIGLENFSDPTYTHHQPLGPLQTINCDQRNQLQSKEYSDSNTNELKPDPIAQHKQLPTRETALIPIRQEPIHDYYDLEPRPFARGKFAQVKRCVKIDTKECFAAKCIKKRRRLVDIRHEILLEIEALKLSSRTEHIVKLYEVYETPNEMILILEMAGGGELQRVLDDEESISEPLVRKMVRQILEGLTHLHDDQIVHLDLKPQNLLLTKPFPNGDIKLCDFGISRRITECEIREICGTPDYTAPEVLQYDPISLNTDMWSLGVVTYVLLSGYSPFGSENKQQTFCNITTCSLDFPSELFKNVSPDAIDFVRKLIVPVPSQRLTSRQALSHRWFSQ